MPHVDNLLNLFGYCCRVHDCTVFHIFQTSVSNQHSTGVILDHGIHALRITHSLFLVTVTWSCVKVTVHPLSHNCHTDMSEL
jgi:hypothetical protein